MNAGSALLLLGGAFAAIKWGPGLIAAANVGRNIRVTFDRVDKLSFFGGITNPRMKFMLYMRLTNPTGSTAKIDFIDVSLNDSSGRPWAVVTNTAADYRIDRRSTQVVPIPVEVKLTNLLLSSLVPAVFSLFQKNEKDWREKLTQSIPAQLAVEGNVRVNGIRVPISSKITVRKEKVSYE